MNSISWFVYLAEVFQNLGISLTVCGFLGAIGAGFCALFAFICGDEGMPSSATTLVYWAIPAIFIACFIPSKTTMYAIAASQLGETVITSPEGKEMIDDTKKILRDYLKSLKKESN